MKELANTKATVRLRKVEDRKEWYLYIESYPVFVKGKSTPQRVREYINRTVTYPPHHNRLSPVDFCR